MTQAWVAEYDKYDTAHLSEIIIIRGPNKTWYRDTSTKPTKIDGFDPVYFSLSGRISKNEETNHVSFSLGDALDWLVTKASERVERLEKELAQAKADFNDLYDRAEGILP